MGNSSSIRNTIEYFDFNNCSNLIKIGAEAFRHANLNPKLYLNNTIVLPGKINQIEGGAFNACMKKDSGAANVEIPGSVITMGAYAFAHWDSANGSSTIIIGDEDNFSNLDLKKSSTPIISSNDSNGISDI